jgi:hypothetical protein
MQMPVISPADWRAGDIDPEGAWKRRLTVAERDDVLRMVDAVRNTGKPMLEITREDAPLGRFGAVLDQMVRDLEHGLGFMLIRGMPTDRFSVEDNRLLFWAIGTHLGVARPQGKASQLMSDVRDAGGQYRGVGGRGYNTSAELDYHVDGSDIVGLLCLKTARTGGKSRLASSVAIHNEILRRDPGLIDLLYANFPQNRQNEHAPDEAPWYNAPIYSMRDGHFAARYTRNHIRSSQLLEDPPRLNDRQHAALDLIQTLAESPVFSFDMWLEPGDLQFVNNHVLVHSRTRYEDHEAPEDKRHLLRLWLAVPWGRPLCEAMREAYKAVEPGTVRGGVKGQNVGPELLAYQARAAASLGMTDIAY